MQFNNQESKGKKENWNKLLNAILMENLVKIHQPQNLILLTFIQECSAALKMMEEEVGQKKKSNVPK